MKLLVCIFSVVMFASCASNMKKEVEQDKKYVHHHKKMGQVMGHNKLAVHDSKDLSTKQKAKLTKLQQYTRSEVKRLNKEIFKLKAILLKNLIAEDYNEKKERYLVKQIKSLYMEKMDVMVKTLRKAKKVLGKMRAEDLDKVYMYIHRF